MYKYTSLLLFALLSFFSMNGNTANIDTVKFSLLVMSVKPNTDATLRCRLVLNQKRLEESFRQAGLSLDKQPNVNWKEDALLIISPQIYFDNKLMFIKTVGITDNARFLVEWGFKEGEHSRIPELHSPGMTSSGSTAIHPQLVVVEFSRKHLNGVKVKCKGPKIVKN